jgi:putative ABC transport system permease protein
LWILGLAALFILLIACINYANLSTANSIERSKEVGVKKTLGSSTSNLRGQFFVESMVMSLLSLAVSVVLVKLLLVPFANLMQTSHPLNFFSNVFSWLLILIIFVTVSFLGGVYPAIHISSFHPIDALKGKVHLGSGFFNFRKALLTAQFAISIGLLIGALVVYWQLDYFMNKTSGFDKESVVVLADPSQKIGDKVQPLIEELQKQSTVNTASISSDYPGSGGYLLPFSVRNRNENTEHVMTSFSAGFNFLETFNIDLLQGRDFKKELDDKISDRIIINEAARLMLELKQPLGKRIVTRDLNDLHQRNREFEIIGVVKNFNFESLHNAIKPMAISLNKRGTFISVRLRSEDLHQSLTEIEAIWMRLAPAVPFEYSFLNDQVSRLYKTELVLSRLLTILTTLIIVIASLGLFGLTLLLFQQRTKEVGIRKVLGASANSIAMLLSKDFFKLIVVAFVIASPLAGWAMHQWLQGFAYRIDIAWWMFAVAGLGAIGIALLTMSFQAVKAAMANPIKSLRTE